MSVSAGRSDRDVVVVVPHLGPGGAQRVVLALARAWSGRGLRVAVVVLNEAIADVYRLPADVERIALGVGFPALPDWMRRAGLTRLVALAVLARSAWRLRRILQQSGAPVVASFIASTNITCILASLRGSWRLVISERNDPARASNGFFWDVLRRRLYRYADTVTANSRGSLETLCEYVPEAKLAFVPNPLELPATPGPAAREAPLILAVGRLHPQKAYDVLLAAFAQVAGELPGWRLRILGEGPVREALRAQAERLGVTERVEWAGQVDAPAPHFGEAGMFVLPSRYEGMPNALLEAMAFGLPVVVSDASPGPLEVVAHEVCGLVVPVEDVDALAGAIRRLAGDPALRRRLGAEARTAVEPHRAERAVEAWNRVLGLHGGGSGAGARAVAAEG